CAYYYGSSSWYFDVW
nr:immunoglobulin heavy chain junction region [Mus musculus]MBK4184927.1 immunoglobulin heavy chain junction region [Mus musculus]